MNVGWDQNGVVVFFEGTQSRFVFYPPAPHSHPPLLHSNFFRSLPPDPLLASFPLTCSRGGGGLCLPLRLPVADAACKYPRRHLLAVTVDTISADSHRPPRSLKCCHFRRSGVTKSAAKNKVGGRSFANCTVARAPRKAPPRHRSQSRTPHLWNRDRLWREATVATEQLGEIARAAVLLFRRFPSPHSGWRLGGEEARIAQPTLPQVASLQFSSELSAGDISRSFKTRRGLEAGEAA